MSEKNKLHKGNFRVLSSNWFVTLSATLIGVFVALYVNEIVASQKLVEAKTNATEKILIEIESNLSSLEEAAEIHQKVYEVLDFLKYIDSESGDLVVPLDTITKFRNAHPNLLIVKDSVMVDESVYAYSDGELDFDFHLPQFELSTVAWNTLLNTGMGKSYSFDCLLHLQGIYKPTEKVILLNEEVFNSFYRTEDLMLERENMLRLLSMLLDFERTTIQAIENGKEEIEHCS